MTDAAMGHQARMAIEPGAAAHTFDSSSEFQEFLSESLRAQETITDTGGIRGTRQHSMERTRLTQRTVGGDITIPVTANRLDLWLPRILGAAESTDTFALAETLPAFGVLVDRETDTYQYTDCKVGKAVFSSAQGELLKLVLSVLGKTEVEGTAWASAAQIETEANYPYAHSDVVFSFGGSAVPVMNWELSIDNAITPRFANSITATDLSPGDLIVRLTATMPFADGETLHPAATAGIAAVITATLGNVSTIFTMPAWQIENSTPVVGSKGEILLELTGECRKSSSTAAITVTNDGDHTA